MVDLRDILDYTIMGRGRNAGYPAPPAQIPACGKKGVSLRK
jgi:hypothetical protein